MSTQQEIRQSIEYHYRFQKGMYFNGRKKIKGATIFFSNHIEDFFWNFSIDINVAAISVPTFIKDVEKVMSDLNKHPAFYITPWTEPLAVLLEELRNQEYQRKFQDTWMFFEVGFK